jgi:hypothetical protein
MSKAAQEFCFLSYFNVRQKPKYAENTAQRKNSRSESENFVTD